MIEKTAEEKKATNRTNACVGMAILREKRKKLGLVRPDVWIPLRDLKKFRQYAERLTKKYEKEQKNDQND